LNEAERNFFAVAWFFLSFSHDSVPKIPS